VDGGEWLRQINSLVGLARERERERERVREERKLF
jgi:hypothetical protein